MDIEIIINLIFSFLLTFIIFYYSIPIFKKILPDNPKNRSSHKFVTPRGGGIVFIFSALISCFIFNSWVLLILLPLIIISFIDDFINLSSWIRFLIQILTSALILYYSQFLNILQINNSFKFLLVFIFFIIFITSILNFTNFMDGIDGIVAGNMLIIFLTLLYNGNYELTWIIGSLLGFLLFNWSPAKIFMGDVGSTFLGALFSISIFSSDSFLEFVSASLLIAPLLLDSFITLLRRLLNGRKVFSAHKTHLYQRLNQSGWSHSRVSILYISATLLMSTFFLFTNIYIMFIYLMILIIIGSYVDKRYALPFNKIY